MKRPSLTTALIREVNVSRLFHALRRYPGSSQRELSALTGLDRATVNIVVRNLDARGLLRRTKKTVLTTGGARRAGRPESVIDLSADAGILLGARLEPGGVSLLATNLAGEVLGARESRRPVQAAAAASVLGEEITAFTAQLPPTRILGLGLGVPALMSAGYLVFGPNLGWYDVDLGQQLEGLFPFPVYIDNDTKVAALAEHLFGVCQESRTFVYLAGHSGVGGGLFLGGTLYRGPQGYAGEVGHMKLVPGGRACACGGRGCLEAYLSERAILADLEAHGLHAETLPEVVAQLGQAHSDPWVRVLAPLMDILALGCANLVCLLNPEQVVVGGTLSVLAAAFEAQIRQAMTENLLPPLRDSYCLVFSPFADKAVPMGGVALALEGFLALPDTVVVGALT